MSEPESFKFQAEVNEVLSLVINSLYSNKEIFLRELISNASDALEKLEFRALTEHGLMADSNAKEIRIIADKDAGTLTIEDTGVGMTREELIDNLGTIAHSGSRAFFAQLSEAKAAATPNFIGQFGVGFYSSYLVADSVTVETRPAGADASGWRWVSIGKGEFTVEPVERAQRGTAVILHMQKEHLEYLDEYRIRNLVTRYSDFVGFPIKLEVERASEIKDAAGDEVMQKSLETINRASALWRRPKSEISDDEYAEFYKHSSHDFEPPLARLHTRLEGAQSFTALLYIPTHAPFDLFDPKRRSGVRLYVKRIFVMDDCEELLPQWLRFLRGIVDSDDLELNVSREILQKSTVVRVISKQLVKKALDLLDELARDKPADYETFWKQFGVVLKEGLHFDYEHRARLAKLVRYRSTAGDGLCSLDDYVGRMKPNQNAIYFAVGDSLSALAASPHLETLRARGYEVLLMADHVDEWAVAGLDEYDDKPLVSAMKADLKLASEDEDAGKEKSEDEKEATSHSEFLAHVKEVLGDRVQDVRLSQRLAGSPCCLVVPENAMHPHMERLMRAHDREAPIAKRIFELNGEHSLVKNLEKRFAADAADASLSEWILLLYDQARLTEGSELEDISRFAGGLTRLLELASS